VIPSSVEVWRGSSQLTGEPIVVVLGGLYRPSSNRKTGPMVQAWILRQDMTPIEAARSGADEAICGGCPLRARVPGTLRQRQCYVNLGHGPRAVWQSWNAGRAQTLSPEAVAPLLTGRALRLGAYGDPAAVPFRVWETLAARASRVTGYTHQWARRGFDARILGLCMGSVDSAADVVRFEKKHPGARYFRTRPKGGALAAGETQCPAAAESDTPWAQCISCGLCGGTRVAGPSVSIQLH